MNPMHRASSTWLCSAKLFTRVLPLLVAFAFSQATVHAHHLPPGFEEIDEFEHSHAMSAGLLHPLSGWDHCLALLVIGGAAILAMRKTQLLPAMFFSGLAAGGALGFGGVALPQAPFVSAAVLLVAGVALVLRASSMPLILAAAVAAFGLWQGNSHALLVTLPQAMAGYAFGFILSSAALMVMGGALAVHLQKQPTRAIRFAGAAAAVLGLVSLAIHAF